MVARIGGMFHALVKEKLPLHGADCRSGFAFAGQAGQKAEFEAAARNFALLLVVPYEVDVVQIVNRGNDKRWRWMLQGDLSWSVEELVP